MISQAELKRMYFYDPVVGIFIRRYKSANNLSRAGDICTSKFQEGYIKLNLGKRGKVITGHRAAWLYMYGEFPPEYIDHINGRRDDNSIKNLRLADKHQNTLNAKMKSLNTSGYKGVSYRRDRGTWIAICRYKKKNCYIGSYKTKEEAAEAYDEKTRELHGEFHYKYMGE